MVSSLRTNRTGSIGLGSNLLLTASRFDCNIIVITLTYNIKSRLVVFVVVGQQQPESEMHSTIGCRYTGRRRPLKFGFPWPGSVSEDAREHNMHYKHFNFTIIDRY